MTTPAEELRAAAVKLRRLFDHLGSEGLAAWKPTPDGPHGLYGVRTVGASCGDALVAVGMWKSTADFVAAMHPAVAFALADWLDYVAGLTDSVAKHRADAATPDAPWLAPALAVARALNGGPS